MLLAMRIHGGDKEGPVCDYRSSQPPSRAASALCHVEVVTTLHSGRSQPALAAYVAELETEHVAGGGVRAERADVSLAQRGPTMRPAISSGRRASVRTVARRDINRAGDSIASRPFPSGQVVADPQELLAQRNIAGAPRSAPLSLLASLGFPDP